MHRYRFLQERLPLPPERRIVVITGARQVGKTTLVRHTYPQLPYFTLDVIEDREALAALHTRRWATEVGEAVLDEAQKEPRVFDKVKFAYDEGLIDFSVLTGSSRFLLLEQIRESLAGRAFLFELWPLMLSEVCCRAGSPPRPPLLDRILTWETSIGGALEELPERGIGTEEADRRAARDHLLEWGGMPELLSLTDTRRREWLRSYQTTWLERDLADLSSRPELEPFRKLQKLAMLRSGQLVNCSSLARDAGIAATTARRYLEYLRISYQVVLLPPCSRNLTSETVKSPKLYWTDLGILRQGTGHWGPADGAQFETFIVTEIMKWLGTSGRDVGLSFYRTRSGLEVDLLLKTAGGLIGIEVKSREGARPEDTRSLRTVARAAGDEWRGGLVVHSGDRLQLLDAEHDLWGVPAHRLL